LTSTDNLNWTTPCTVATNLAAGDSAYNAGPLTFTFTATRQSNGAIAQSTSTIQLSAATANFNLTAAIAPTTVTVDSSYITTLKLTLTATTNLSANTVYADYTDAAGNDQSIVFTKGSASGSTQNWSATIATGAGPLPQQSTLPVTFTASGTAGMQQATVQETISPPLLPMQISTQLLLAGQSVNRICIPNNNKTTAAYVVQITITNFDVTNAANTYALTGQSPPNVLNPTPTTSEASGTATISYTIPSNTNFGNNTSQFTFHFSATRKADSQSVQTAPDPAWPLVNTSGSNGC
jgi:hypothetical protein